MKIYDWRRFLTFIFIVILFIALILSLITRQEPQIKEIKEHTVRSGETYWSIGTANRPDNMSIQEYVFNLRQLNNDTNCIIRAGQTIQVPIYEEV